MNLKGRHFLTLKDFTKEEITYMLDLAADLKDKKKKGIPVDKYRGMNVALIFEKTSTRTRCSFEVAAHDMGMGTTYLDPSGSQIGKKESIEDTARVLGRMFDGIEYRGFGQERVEELAKHAGVPVWNGLTNEYHPTQMLADLLTIREHFGTLENIHLVYMGDARYNMGNSLMIACAKMGMHFTACTSEKYFPDAELVETCRGYAKESGGTITLTEDVKAGTKGADVIDTAISPFSMGTSQPATEVMVETFKGTPYDTGLDQNLLAEIAEYFRPMREEALKTGLMNTKVLGVNIKTLLYQVPGGMLSNLVSQLKDAGAEDKYQAVLEEIPRVRKDYGEPPLVTPSSQIVGTQAVLNVLQGERYKMITKESKKVLAGEFGRTVKPFNKEVQKKAIGDTEPITCRPADLIEPQLEGFKKSPVVQKYKQQDEDVLSYALFPAVAEEFFKYREAQQTKVDPKAADTENKTYPV